MSKLIGKPRDRNILDELIENTRKPMQNSSKNRERKAGRRENPQRNK